MDLQIPSFLLDKALMPFLSLNISSLDFSPCFTWERVNAVLAI